MAEHARNVIARLARRVGQSLAPVFFGKDPSQPTGLIGPQVANVINRANLVANEIQLSMSQQAIEMLRALSDLGDQATDLIGTLPAGERTNALNKLQEALDLPLFAYTEAWVKTIEIVMAGNRAAIAASRKAIK